MDHSDFTEPCPFCGCVVHKESCPNSMENSRKAFKKIQEKLGPNIYETMHEVCSRCVKDCKNEWTSWTGCAADQEYCENYEPTEAMRELMESNKRFYDTNHDKDTHRGRK